VFTDRSALAREAMAALRELPQAEEEDYKIIVQVLASRLLSALNDEVDNLPDASQPKDAERTRLSRDAAHWVICKCEQELRQAMFSEIPKRAKLVDAKPLPDVMVFPITITLEASSKNIYGVLPPTNADGELISQRMLIDDRIWLANKSYAFEGSPISQVHFDDAWFGNRLGNTHSRRG
jgi:type III restriction enzyme